MPNRPGRRGPEARSLRPGGGPSVANRGTCEADLEIQSGACSAVFVLGFAISGAVSYRLLQSDAREEILDNAR